MPATETPREVAEMLDTGHYQHRRAREMQDPAFKAEYLRAASRDRSGGRGDAPTRLAA